MAEREGFEVRFRWVRRCYIQDADDLSKFVDRMDFSLTPEGLAHVWQQFGPWEVDRYASPSNTTCVRFNALFDSANVEGVNALTQDLIDCVLRARRVPLSVRRAPLSVSLRRPCLSPL